MSNSYIIELERLRVQLKNTLAARGVTVTDDEPLNSLVNKVNSINVNEPIIKAFTNQTYELDDINGEITQMTAAASGLLAYATYINLPGITSTVSSGFKNLSRARIIRLPNLAQTSAQCFQGCSNLEELYLDNCTVTGNDSIENGLNKIWKIYAPKLSTIGYDSITNNPMLTDLTLSDNITSIAQYFLCNCTALTELRLGNIGTATANNFVQNDNALKIFKAKGFDTIGTLSSWFTSCGSMLICDFGIVNTIGGSQTACFTNNTAMEAIVFRNTENLPTLSSTNFLNWLVANVQGWHIYVDDDLLDTYKTTSPWSNVASYFKPLSEYDEDAILNGTEVSV